MNKAELDTQYKLNLEQAMRRIAELEADIEKQNNRIDNLKYQIKIAHEIFDVKDQQILNLKRSRTNG